MGANGTTVQHLRTLEALAHHIGVDRCCSAPMQNQFHDHKAHQGRQCQQGGQTHQLFTAKASNQL